MTGAIIKNLVAVALSAASVFMMWLGSDTLEEARVAAGSTFEIPTHLIALSGLYFLLAGSLFTIVLTHRSKKDPHVSYLLAAAIIPTAAVVLPLLAYEGVGIDLQRIRWILSPSLQSAAAFAIGSVLTTVLWRLIGKLQPVAPK